MFRSPVGVAWRRRRPLPPGLNPLLWSGMFESNNLGDEFYTDNPGDRDAPNSVVITTERARAGLRSARVTVEGPGETFGQQRAEIVPLVRTFVEGDNLWFGLSVWLDAGFPTTPASWQLISQWHQASTSGSPPIELNVDGGEFALTGENAGGTPMGRQAIAPATTGQWHDFQIRIRFSATPAIAEIEVWLNGVQELAPFNPAIGTLYAGGGEHDYWKSGIYRNPVQTDTPLTLWLDEMRVGTTRAAVTPAPIPVTATAALGGLAASAAAQVIPPVYAAAALGGLAATAGGVRTAAGLAGAPLGALTASVAGTRIVPGIAAAPLGGLSATALGTFVSYLGATGPALNPVVWLVDRDTLDVVGPALQQWDSLDLSPVVNSPGSCSLTYPAGAPGFATLWANVTPRRDQEIEVWPAGSVEHRQRWLLQVKTGDDLQPGELWTFSGAGLEELLREALVGPQDTESQELIFSAATYGTVLITAVQLAQERDGVLDGITWDFSTTLDSNGDPWESAITDLKFAPDDTVLAVAEAGPGEVIGEFALGPDRVLHAWNFGARGTDRTVGATPLRLAAGANLAEAARRESARAGDAATAALGKGAEGQYQWATDATAEAERGRRVEVAVDAGQIATAGGVLAATQGRLEVLAAGVSERTHGVVFGPGQPIPGVDYDVADWAFSVTGGAFTRQRITQWTLRFQREGRARGTVRTNTLLFDEIDRLRAQLEQVRRGGAIVGTSTLGPEVDDGKFPAQVLGLTASSSAYVDNDGATRAVVLAGWTDVVTNADATAADDIVGYLPQFRYTGGGGLPSGWQPLPQVADNQIDFDRLLAGEALQVRVAAIDRFDHIGAWSSSYSLTTAADATAPPVPSTPAVSNYIGILRIDIDGLGSVGQSMPDDFLRFNIHASQSSGFTVNPAAYPTGTLIGQRTGAGSFAWAPPTLLAGAGYDETWYVKITAEDRSGNVSAASAQDSAVTGQVEEGDVATVNVGALVSGFLTAIVGIIGQLQTAEAPDARVVLDSDGLYKYDALDMLRVAITDDETFVDGTIVTGLPGESRIEMGNSSFGRDNLEAVDGVGTTTIIGQVYNQNTGDPLWNGILVQRTDDIQQDILQVYGSGLDPGLRILDPTTGVNVLRVVEDLENLLRIQHSDDSAVYLGDLFLSSVSQGAGILVVDQNDDTCFIVHKSVFQSMTTNMRLRIPTSSGDGRVELDESEYAFFGFVDGSNRHGIQSIVADGRTRARVNVEFDVVSPNQSAYRPIRASAFTVSSSVESKQDFAALPGSALAAVRNAPGGVVWRFNGDADHAAKHVGPMAETLPEWLVHPPTAAAAHDTEEQADQLPQGESLDLLSMIGVLWEAVRELDEEVDQLRQEAGRPAPKRRRTADLIADLIAGRMPRRT